ncbi:MAG TPA: cytochrome c [Gemmata sp.]|nr:cytochrome c [Gemmata sp.]
MRRKPLASGPRCRFLVYALVCPVLGLCGCGDSVPDYPSTLSFPSRADRLVLKLPESPPPGPDAAGERDAAIARLDAAGGKTADPALATHDKRLALNRFLKDVFGTPAAPTIAGEADAAVVERLGLTADKLAEGSRLFRRHCEQCHNLAGDGRGPAGIGVVPFPRDFRQGKYKFVTTGTEKPRRADILRTLAEGLKGTAMPSFGLLPETDRDAMARYATYLAIRGQVEYQSLASALDGNAGDPRAAAAANLKTALGEWDKAENGPQPVGITAEPDDGPPGSSSHAAAVRRGYQLFTAKTENSCITCHGDFGRKPVLRYDVWGTVAKPADFTATTLKAGTRPQDIFARIRGGIPPVGMPAHPELSHRQVWDLVRFVRSAPYQVQLPEDVRAAVYSNR